jgi:hypothetical protein
MKTSLLSAICLLIAVTFAASTALAKDEGFYVGASVGAVTIEEKISDFDDIDFDESNFAFKIFGGYQFNGLFALEGGYVDFGSSSNDFLDLDVYGIDAFGVVGIPIGPIRGFAKAGGIYWDAEAEVLDIFNADDDGFDFAAGVGLELEILGLGVRGEIEYFDVADSVWMYTVGATFTF